ncbi:C40 family peptidase [Edwardsiella tarda]|uniref:C40 family peptidase n=1 Tax=Edwardsiella tarda TaxID=636 RepID=UPI003F657409
MAMLDDDILAHAARMAPAESCGFVIRTPMGERYLPCQNRSLEPRRYFRMIPQDYLQACARGELVALVHSHPHGDPYLSAADRRLQIASALPWWLVCEGRIARYRPVPLLLGRPFVHGHADCYALLRDAYHLAGIALPAMHYDADWHQQGADLYLQELPRNGFSRIPLAAAQAGDVLLCCFGCSVANHAAIYCDDGQLLHHLPNQLSKREGYSERWQRQTHSLWRHHAWHASAFTAICNDLAAATLC